MRVQQFLPLIIAVILGLSIGILGCGEDPESARILEISPEDGGRLYTDNELEITFDITINTARANGISAKVIDKKASWKGEWFDIGNQDLLIDWVDENGNTGSEEISIMIQEVDTFVCSGTSEHICDDGNCGQQP